MPATPNAKQFNHKQALRQAFKAVMNKKSMLIVLPATVIAAICQIVFVATFATSGLYALTESFAAGSINAARGTTLLGHFAWGALLGLVGYLVYNYAVAEVILRTSRTLDQANTDQAQSRRIALGSLAGLVGIDAITWVLVAMSAIMVAGANIGFLGTKSLGVAGVVLAVLINAIAAYIWLGLMAARQMAAQAIVLGQVSVGRAYMTGWTLYNRQFGRITNGLILITMTSFIIALPASLFSNMLGMRSVVTSTLVIPVAAITQAVLLIVGTTYFLQLYRFVIAREYDSELGLVLSGRQPLPTRLNRRLVVLGAIAVAWVVIMMVLVVYASPIAKAIIR